MLTSIARSAVRAVANAGRSARRPTSPAHSFLARSLSSGGGRGGGVFDDVTRKKLEGLGLAVPVGVAMCPWTTFI